MSKTAEDLQKELEAARAELEALKNKQKLANEPRKMVSGSIAQSVADDFRDMAKKKKLKIEFLYSLLST